MLRRIRISAKRRKRRKNPFAIQPEQLWALQRRKNEKIFRGLCFTAIMASLLFLGGMVYSLVSQGAMAFVKTEVRLTVTLPSELNGDFRGAVNDALFMIFPQVVDDQRELGQVMSRGAYHDLRSMAQDNRELLGRTQEFWLPAAGAVDLFVKNKDINQIDENSRVSELQRSWLQQLKEQNRLRITFNSGFFTNADSQEPEQAGISGGIAGSFFTIIVCIAFAFPLGVATALYLEEFSRKNWFTNLIEININNLAAVPSIIYGLLGLSIYINWMGMPRSSSLVGGLVLALLVLPVIVIATRNALRSVPRDIRYAALAMGATPVQVALNHTLLYALPGIMTGVILSIARALGETSPLLMIGMVAFVTDIPKSITSPAASLPVQIYLWSNNPEPGFVEKTAAVIIVLLLFLGIINAIAAWIRQKYEIKW